MSIRQLIVGLGNPGSKYRSTRHNAGFMVVERVATAVQKSLTKTENKALVAKLRAEGQTALLAKPQTYMNKSGQAVGKLAEYYQIKPESILVIYDDLDLEPGQLRIRPDGGHGGHNGLKSVLAALETKQVPRLRIGIGRPEQGSVTDYVLDQFNQDEWQSVDQSLTRAKEAIRDYLSGNSLATLMNNYN